MDLWGKLESSNEMREKIWAKSRSFKSDVWFRFKHKKSALGGLVVIILLMLFAFVGPFFTAYSFDNQKLDYTNIPPILKVTSFQNHYFFITGNLKIIEVSKEGRLLQPLEKIAEDAVNKKIEFAWGEGKIVMDYKEKPTAILDEKGLPIKETKSLWNKDYILGTDGLGRDLLTRLMYGCRISLIVAFIATIVNMTIGIIYGGISGFVGGSLDNVMMRIVDIISTIPLTLYVILIMVIMENGFLSIIVALSSVYWVSMARIVRGQIYALKENEFVYAARTIGSSGKTILFKHLLPNAMGPILVTATMLIPAAIFMEAFLGFIGLGIAPPMASLGTMCNDSIQMLRTTPYQLFMPSLVICIIMFAFNYVGDGLRDALDPKLKK